MKASILTALIPATFEYKYTDTEGEAQTETINLKLRRLSLAVAERELKKLLEPNDENTEALAKVFVQTIDSWNIFLDDAEKEMLPITEEWFLSKECPADFGNQLGFCIVSTLNGNPQKASNSPNGSAPAAKSSRPLDANSENATASLLQAVSGA